MPLQTVVSTLIPSPSSLIRPRANYHIPIETLQPGPRPLHETSSLSPSHRALLFDCQKRLRQGALQLTVHRSSEKQEILYRTLEAQVHRYVSESKILVRVFSQSNAPEQFEIAILTRLIANTMDSEENWQAHRTNQLLRFERNQLSTVPYQLRNDLHKGLDFKPHSPPPLATIDTNTRNSRVQGNSIKSSARDTRRKHTPIDISRYLYLEGYDTPDSASRRPSLPFLERWISPEPAQISSPESPRKYIPIVIPESAQPKLDASPKPSFQETIQSWPAPPKLRPEGRSLQPIAERPPVRASHVENFEKKHAQIINEIFEKMNSSSASLASQAAQDHNHHASRSAQTAPNGISPNVGLNGGGQTHLSGLVCNVHRTSGQEPHALVGATTTILGDKLYVFGGRVLSRSRPQLTADLYELDLISRHWSKVEASGQIPPPRYFHSVCPLGDTKLVCYGGMSPAATPSRDASQTSLPQTAQPEVDVMSDVHIFDATTRKWMLIPTMNAPQGRYAHCATILPSGASFASASATSSAIQHNISSASDPHSGSLGVQLDGTGGAEMLVVGGQDSSNHYIEQISVFNLRSLKWTHTTSLGRQCGAYRSVVAPLSSSTVSQLGAGPGAEEAHESSSAPSMLIYSNYNFLDVQLELQIRSADGTLSEKPMNKTISPPGLRFPNGGVIDNHFVVSGTYLTSSKQEYALWALDLGTLEWGRIDAGGAVFGQGSWNRGVIWHRRNKFVILGHRKRSLVEDYNHRRINFSHVCVVELEAFGLFDNPRRSNPNSGYISISSPPISMADGNNGGRPISKSAEVLGQALLDFNEISDMDLIAIGGEKIPVNSRILSRRWGAFFDQLLIDSVDSGSNILSEAISLRPSMISQASRISTVTITPSLSKSSTNNSMTSDSASNTLVNSIAPSVHSQTTTARNNSISTTRGPMDSFDPSFSHLPSAPSRPRTLFLPHTPETIRLMLHYLYTSSLPPPSSPLCTPQTLCSLLQLARPYAIDGLLEATVDRLHKVFDSRNAAAVFNASAMAAGGGRGLLTQSEPAANELDENTETLAALERRGSEPLTDESSSTAGLNQTVSREQKKAGLRIDTSGRRHQKTDSQDSISTATSASTNTSFSFADSDVSGAEDNVSQKEQIWTGDLSGVIGLQKRGLRGLMEGRRLRERGGSGGGSAVAVGAGGTPISAELSQPGTISRQGTGLGII